MLRAGRCHTTHCFTAAIALLLLAATAPLAGAADAAFAARAKIAPWVREHATPTRSAEFIVVLGDQADLSPAANFPDKASKGRFVHDVLYAKALTTQGPLLAWLDAHNVAYRSFYILNAILVDGTLDVAEALSQRADVARIDGNPEVPQIQPVQLTPEELRAASYQAQAVQAIEPGVSSIRAPEVWATGATGQGIVIGGADTGVMWNHSALKAKYRGWNGTAANHDYNWHDSIHSGGGVCGFDAPAPCDDYGHGTHTVGTVLGSDSSGTNQVGVAPGARFIACRNMDQGNGTPARYLECMEWFLAPYPVGGTPAQGDPLMAPDITTNSWGCPASEGCVPASLQAGVEAQRAAGIMFVAAAGNTGAGGCSTVTDPPSFYDATYTVGAYQSSNNLITSFSSRGPVTADGSGRTKPDICAPGYLVRSTLRTGDYGPMSGTSMATPHVAGAIALLWSAYPALKNRIDATENILDATAVAVSSTQCDAGGIPNNVYGWGRLDIKAAVDMAPVAVGPDGPGASLHGVALAPTYPNPARGYTLLRFRNGQPGAVDLAVFSADGRRVRTLVRGTMPAGERTVRWDGLADDGLVVPPALYHVRVAGKDASASQKLIWLGR